MAPALSIGFLDNIASRCCFDHRKLCVRADMVAAAAMDVYTSEMVPSRDRRHMFVKRLHCAMSRWCCRSRATAWRAIELERADAITVCGAAL